MAEVEAPGPTSPPNGRVIKKDELAQHIRNLWANKGYEVPENERVGVPIADLVDHSVHRNAQLIYPS